MTKHLKYFVTFNQGKILIDEINDQPKFLANEFYLQHDSLLTIIDNYNKKITFVFIS